MEDAREDGVEAASAGSSLSQGVKPIKAGVSHVHVARAREPGKPNAVHGGKLEGPRITSHLHSRLRGWRRIIHNGARVLVLVAAIGYVVLSLVTASAVGNMLLEKEGRVLDPLDINSYVIASYAGDGTIYDSPLVQEILHGDTNTNRLDAVYLQSDFTISLTNCSEYENFNTHMYGAEYLRFMFGHLKSQLAYSVTTMSDLELIVPIVDCTNLLVARNDITSAKVYYLVRRVSDPTKLLLLSTSMSAQNYYIDAHHRRGPGLVVSIGFIEDMTASVNYSFAIALNYPYEAVPTYVVCEVMEKTSDGFWYFQDIPINPLTDDQRVIVAAWRDGFYVDDINTQSNIRNWYWEQFPNDPVSELSMWRWRGYTQLRDSWAWTHYIHLIFALSTATNIILLLIIVFKKLASGNIWIGDAFSSISSSLLYRGVLVILSNHLDGYYTWTEYTLAVGYSLGDSHQTVYYKPDLLYSDILTIYLNAASILSYAFKERVHPLLAAYCFVLAFAFRTTIAQYTPEMRKILVTFADNDYEAGVSKVSSDFDKLSPFNLRTYSAIDTANRASPVLAGITSTFASFIWFFIYFVILKFRRYMKRKKTAKTDKAPTNRLESRRFSGDGKLPSDENKTRSGHLLQTTKTQLTLFESATGSVLQSRFGVITDYDNYVTDSTGRRCATADAVYSSGFIILNRKFLVATDDLITIIIIKLTRMRFRNVFVYDLIDGDTPNQTARLLYPSTITWRDLMEPGISDLA